MKRFIAAVSLAVLATSAIAADVGKPFEQLDIDRALPNLSDSGRTQLAATAGGSRSDAEIATDRETVSPWANDPHFVAPPQ
jgi:opacity protein-like surface antigen